MINFERSFNVATESMKKEYYGGTYKSEHWAMVTYKLKDPKVVGLANYQGSEYSVFLNHTDKRGYRCIVLFINNQDMGSTLNRDFTLQEQRGLSFVVEMVESV